MRKKILAAVFLLCFALFVPAMASVIPQDYSENKRRDDAMGKL